eukprot:s10585_g2.t1
MLTKEQELQELHGHFTAVYRSAEVVRTQPAAMPEFNAAQVERCLRLISAGKATPSHCVPSVVWKICHHELTPYLQDQLRRLWSSGEVQVPRLWRDAWFALLPKPSRVCKRPKDLRPIALQCSLGKASIKLLCEEVRPYIIHFLQGTPQFAYCKGRDVQMALLRAFSHFDQVRQEAATNVDNIHNRHQGRSRKDISGAITLSLDMEQAFDRLPKSLIIRALQAAQVPAHLIHLVDVWHRNACYHLQHGGHTAKVQVQQGVRQGCLLAPLLFACATGLLISELPDVAGPAWNDILSLYADDILAQEWLQDVADVARVLQRWGKLIDFLGDHGLQLSQGKSVILARIGGLKGRAIWKKFLVRTAEGWFVRVPLKVGDTLIALKEEHRYLGAMISYKTYEASTFRYRLAQARTQYGRLKKLLHSRQHLTLQQRMRMYRTCVWSTLSYSLHATGLGPAQVAQLRGVVATHLRAIARSPRHLTGETSESLHARLGFPDPMQQLCSEMENLVQRIRDSPLLVPGCPCSRHAVVVEERLREQLHLDQRSHVRLVQVPDARPVACSFCGQYFPNEVALRTHIGHQHATLQEAVRDEAATLSRDQYSIGSVPTCRFCKHAFCSWQRLHKHIKQGRCMARLQQLHSQQERAGVLDAVNPTSGPSEPSHCSKKILRAVPIAKCRPVRSAVRAAEDLAQLQVRPFVQNIVVIRQLAILIARDTILDCVITSNNIAVSACSGLLTLGNLSSITRNPIRSSPPVFFNRPWM